MASSAKTSSTTRSNRKKKRKKLRAKSVGGTASAASRKKTGKSKKRGSTKIVKIAWPKVDWRDYGPCVIGVDEVGRGCLAGPVFASAVLFTHDGLVAEVTDSKLLTRDERETLSLKIHDLHPVEIAQASVEEIDEINILWASMLAMKRAIEALEARMAQTEWAEHVGQAMIVVDGRTRIPGLASERQVPLVKGDLRCAPVSAASIAAKVARDRHMMTEATRFPQYGFELHKGYGTPVHQAALATHGPCALHRRTFAGVKERLVRESDGVAPSVPNAI